MNDKTFLEKHIIKQALNIYKRYGYKYFLLFALIISV
jgi:hypothetical protein